MRGEHARESCQPLTGVLALIISIGFIACTTSSSPQEQGVSTVGANGRTVRAVRSLLHNDPVLAWAQSIAVSECMDRRGFHFPVVLSGSPALPEARKDLPGIVSISESYAAAYGYGPNIGRDGSNKDTSPAATQLPTSKSVRVRYLQALWGRKGGPRVTISVLQGAKASAAATGCFADGSALVFGSVRRLLEIEYLPQGILRYQGNAWREKSLTANLEQYRECMARQGVHVNFPQDTLGVAQERFGQRSRDDAGSREEIQLAMEDARCQSTSHVVSAYERSLVRVAIEWLVANRDALLAADAAKSQAMDRARGIVAKYMMNNDPSHVLDRWVK